MPADFHVDPERNVVLSRGWGRLEDADLRDHQERLRAHPDFRPEMSQLFDLQGVTEVAVTSDGIHAFARGTPFAPTAKRALVVARPAMFGMSRMLQILTQEVLPDTVVQYDDIDSARRWLGVPEEGGAH